jgi:hypothetical protein
MPTLLSEIIEKQVGQSIALHLARITDRAADDLAGELLRDPAFKAEMLELVRAAFRKALLALQTETP